MVQEICNFYTSIYTTENLGILFPGLGFLPKKKLHWALLEDLILFAEVNTFSGLCVMSPMHLILIMIWSMSNTFPLLENVYIWVRM